MPTDLTRRKLLQLAGYGPAAALLTPILSQVAAHAAGGKDAARRRVLFVVQSNGISPVHLTPAGVKRPKNGRPTNDKTEEYALPANDLHPALNPLEPYRDRLTLVNGLSGKIAEGGSGGHSTQQGALGCYPGSKVADATIDVRLGSALPGVIPHVGLGILGKADQTFNYQLSAAGPNKPVPIQCSPELAYRALFGSVAGGGRAAFDNKTRLLDYVADDVKRARNGLAAEEKAKLDQYLEACESLRDRQGKIDALRDDLARHAPDVSPAVKNPTECQRLQAQADIAAAALVTGLTNVVTLASAGGGQQYLSFPELGIPVDGHHYGHGGGVDGKTYEDCFVAVRKYHCELIVRIADKLKAVKEGDGTALDNTLIVYLSDSGDGHHPSLLEWPLLLLGNLGGKLKAGGRHLQLPTYGAKGHRTLANLYCTLLHAAGKPADEFGVNDPGLKGVDQKGVIAELLA